MLTALLISLQSSPVQVEYRNREGLFITVADVPVVQGSFLQTYEPGWTKGYYSSNWNDQTVTQVPGGADITFGSGQTKGKIEVRQQGDNLTILYRVQWDGPKLAHFEMSFGHLWAPAFVDGKAPGDLSRVFTSKDTIEERTITTGTQFEFGSGFGSVDVDLSHPAVLFDARNYTGDFAEGKELLWLGASNVPLEPGKPVELKATWKITPRPKPVVQPVTMDVEPKSLDAAYGPDPEPLPAIPAIKETTVGGGKGFYWRRFIVGDWPYRLRPQLDLLSKVMERRWESMGSETGGTLWGSIRNLDLPPGGYTLFSFNNRLEIVGQDEEGLRNGLLRAAEMSVAQDGSVVVPPMRLRDWPVVGWRGAHLFVGPKAREFHADLRESIFAPMFFNHVVLQCERTAWKSLPGTETPITMPREALAGLFEENRKAGIEPIPLIQSWGHMGWIFANNQNLDLAHNRAVPFGIDPRKPAARDLVTKIWDEAVELLKPKTIHFGLDEVDMRGWTKEDPELLTQLWEQHLPFLGGIAKKHGVEMMLWGDQLLAPGEAPDAMNGHSKAIAKRRRDAVPRGATIADWHYKNDANPAIYTSLDLFKKEGLKPIASTWYRPENVRGFIKAAEKAKVGVLQTTWAGYESTLENMLAQPQQLEMYLLAGEYAWSGRPEPASAWRPSVTEILRRKLLSRPSPTASRPGKTFAWSEDTQFIQIGRFRFQLNEGQRLRSVLSEEGAKQPDERTFNLDYPDGHVVALAVTVKQRVAHLKPVAEVIVTDEHGKTTKLILRQGEHVETAGRQALRSAMASNLCAVELWLPETVRIEKVTVRALDATAGLAVHGITVSPD